MRTYAGICARINPGLFLGILSQFVPEQCRNMLVPLNSGIVGKRIPAHVPAYSQGCSKWVSRGIRDRYFFVGIIHDFFAATESAEDVADSAVTYLLSRFS